MINLIMWIRDMGCHIVGGVPNGDIKQLLGGVRLIAVEFVHQGPASCAGLECRDDIGVGFPRELMVLF
jgi:hypothetical protein